MFSIRWACNIEEITKWRQATTNRCTCTRCSRTASTRSRINNQVGVALLYCRRSWTCSGPFLYLIFCFFLSPYYIALRLSVDRRVFASPRVVVVDGSRNYSRMRRVLRHHDYARSTKYSNPFIYNLLRL